MSKFSAFRIRKWWLIIAIAMPPLYPSAAQVPGLAWENVYGHNGANLNATALDFDENSNSLFVAGSGKRIDLPEDYFWLWQIDDGGNRILDIEIELPNAVQITSNLRNYIQSIKAMPDGNVILAIEYPEGIFNFAVYDLNERQLQLMDLSEVIQSNQARIREIEVLPDGSLLLTGSRNGIAYALSMSADFQKKWEAEYDHKVISGLNISTPSTSEIAGTIFQPNGNGYVFLSNMLYTPSGSSSHGPEFVSLITVDSNGAFISEKRFPGRKASISRMGSDRIGVAFDAGQSYDQLVNLAVFDEQLEEISEVEVYENTNGIVNSFFVSYLIASDEIFIAGDAAAPLLITATLNQSLEKTSEFSGATEYGPGFLVGLTSDLSSVYLLRVVIYLNQQDRLNNRISVVKISADRF